MNMKVKEYCIYCKKDTWFQSEGKMPIKDFNKMNSQVKKVHKNIGTNLRLKMKCTECGFSFPYKI